MNRTAQREAILKELRSVKTHPTADELYAALRVKLPTISLGTVYRNLEQMSRPGSCGSWRLPASRRDSTAIYRSIITCAARSAARSVTSPPPCFRESTVKYGPLWKSWIATRSIWN